MSKVILKKTKNSQSVKNYLNSILNGLQPLVSDPNFDITFLTFWLGDQCYIGEGGNICDKNANYFIKVAKTYPSNFFPFYRLEDDNRDTYIFDDLKNVLFVYIITLNRDTPGAFDVFYSDYFLGDLSKVYYKKIEAQNENELVNQLNKILKDKYIYMKRIGPPSNPDKYGMIYVLGKGAYGVNYMAKNLDMQPNENEYYAVKFLNDPRNPKQALEEWEKEKQCLIDVLDLCKKGGVLCYKDSFVFKDSNGKEYFVIITPFLEGYLTLNDYMDKNQLTKEEALDIYAKIVEIKNDLTDLCISHSDMHLGNIMYNPLTHDIKLIDFGRCQTPDEEIDEWFGDNRIPNRTKDEKNEQWNKYSDLARLKQIRLAFYYHLFKAYPTYVGEEDRLFKDFVKPIIPGCKRIKKSAP
jgi:serine/threonine protein kinase